jgi:hypothetical protein
VNATGSRIEIVKPFYEAFELTKVILFRPFDLYKWCVIGFAAFLSNLSGGGLNFNYNFRNWRGSASSYSPISQPLWNDLSFWILPFLIAAVLLGLAIVLAFLWVGSRGRFIFTDCIVRNRAAIAEPWREFRREGDSMFLFSLVVIAVLLGFAVVGGVPVLLIWTKTQVGGFSLPGLIGLMIVAPLFLLLVISWVFAREFMVPVMYRQRCNATTGFRAVVRLVREYPGEILLYILFFIVLGIGSAIVIFVLMCATCCIVLIPYIGTVILLPVFVLFRAYMLLFLRQFGPEYDVWAGITKAEPPNASAPPELPPPIPPLPA